MKWDPEDYVQEVSDLRSWFEQGNSVVRLFEAALRRGW